MPKQEGLKQRRYTLEDCITNQKNLTALIKLLISQNRPLNTKEKQKFYDMLPKALLSQGTSDQVSFVIENGWFTFASVQNMALRFAQLKNKKICLKTEIPVKVETTINISELWSFLFSKLLFLYPKATGEAIHMSAETIERAKQGAFVFDSGAVLENE